MTYQRFYGHGFHTGKGFTLIEILVVMAIIGCLLYTSPSPRDVEESRMPSSA